MIWKKPKAWCPECSEHVYFCFSEKETTCAVCRHTDKPEAFAVPKAVLQESGFMGLFVRLRRYRKIRNGRVIIKGLRG